MRFQQVLLFISIAQFARFVNTDCPASYGSHPVLIISFDGFRADYLERGLTPNIKALAEAGVHAPYMKTTYPTVTFTNHYTIVTGSYPEFHGIIANKFFDPEINKTFKSGSEESLHGYWWGAEPIWNTVSKQSKISATYFWPGSDAEIDDRHPSYWIPYEESTPFEERVDQVLEWLSLPEETRPSWIGLYFHEPDSSGHWFGPGSSEVDDQLIYVDLMLKRLLDGLEVEGIRSCVNIIINSDHGMARSGEEYIYHLQGHSPYEDYETFEGSFARIRLHNNSEAMIHDMMSYMVCKNQFVRLYEPEGLPTRLHFSNNPRIEDIVFDLDPGFTVRFNSTWSRSGEHGYDNYFKKTNALFLASGPAFQQGIEMEPFQNIELYNLMCFLAGVDPAPNNGTEGALYYILREPPEDPVLPDEPIPPTSEFPTEGIESLLHLSGCSGDLDEPEPWLLSLDFSETEREELKARHLPWGIPHSGDLPANLTLLHHIDHVTAYSQTLKMPLWTSFSVEGPRILPMPGVWSSDVRLNFENTIKCSDYDHLAEQDVSMFALFPYIMSQNESLYPVPFLVSNAIPMANSQRKDRWYELVETLIPKWVVMSGPLNIVIGPVFDNDADSHVDDFRDFSIPEVPSHYFVVLTRCLRAEISIDRCPHDLLDVFSFIYPMFDPVSNCLDQERYALEFNAKVHDVELATGLTFYPDLKFRDRVVLQQRITSNLWPLN